MNVEKLLNEYGNKLTIGVLGGHSALDVCAGAKKYGFRTVAVCQEGREKTYAKYYKSRGESGCIDEVILVNKFADITAEDVQEKLRHLNTVFVHNRYFWVYCDFEEIEKDFKVPIFGSREMLKLEERDVPNNQYWLLDKAGIRKPKIFDSPRDIDRLAIVKVNEAERGYERAFFFCHNAESFKKESTSRRNKGLITWEALDTAVIEEYIVGAPVNFNFFYSPLTKSLELMGTDTRRQTNLDGFLRLPADEQKNLREYMEPTMIETGHVTVTVKESLIEKAYAIGEKFVKATQEHCNRGIIGPFALQGAIASEKGREELVIFDVSMRIPGSPGTAYTPYTKYLYGKDISYGERIAMEICRAQETAKLSLVTS